MSFGSDCAAAGWTISRLGITRRPEPRHESTWVLSLDLAARNPPVERPSGSTRFYSSTTRLSTRPTAASATRAHYGPMPTTSAGRVQQTGLREAPSFDTATATP